MTVSDMAGPEGERDEPETGGPKDEAGEGGAGGSSDGDEPIELTEEAARLDLDDDDPPLPWLQGDDEDEDFEGTNFGQTIVIVLLGLLAIGVAVGGIWWATSGSDDNALLADGSTIEAPDTPYKTKPDDPGGKVFEGTGDTSFPISEGQKRPARLGEATGSPAPGFATMEKKPPAKGAPAGMGETEVPGVGVQVAAYSNRAQAEEGWQRLSQQYEVLSGLKYRVVQGQADIGTVYRLQAVTPDAAAARTLCQQLKAAGQNCQVKN